MRKNGGFIKICGTACATFKYHPCRGEYQLPDIFSNPEVSTKTKLCTEFDLYWGSEVNILNLENCRWPKILQISEYYIVLY